MRATVKIRKGEGRSLKAGGAWIYDNEIEAIEGAYENGSLVNAVDFDGYPLGTGFINDRSAITVRMLSRRADTVIDEDFLKARVRAAIDYRRRTVDMASCRLIFGEAAFLSQVLHLRNTPCFISPRRSPLRPFQLFVKPT